MNIKVQNIFECYITPFNEYICLLNIYAAWPYTVGLQEVCTDGSTLDDDAEVIHESDHVDGEMQGIFVCNGEVI